MISHYPPTSAAISGTPDESDSYAVIAYPSLIEQFIVESKLHIFTFFHPYFILFLICFFIFLSKPDFFAKFIKPDLCKKPIKALYNGFRHIKSLIL